MPPTTLNSEEPQNCLTGVAIRYKRCPARGSTVTGGCVRGGALGVGARGYAKAPPREGRRGLKYEPYSAGFSSSLSLDLSNGFAGSLVSPELGSKR